MVHAINPLKLQLLESRLGRLFDEACDEGFGREALAAMASVLQRGLVVQNPDGDVPYTMGLDLLMRAVKHTLIDPRDAVYIREKLRAGALMLDSRLEPQEAA